MRITVLDARGSGPSAFAYLLRLPTGHLDHVDQAIDSAFIKLQNVVV